ncbi:MAG: pyridoxal 5'-phosphate synthase glutaminase subunit PdxT [Nitrososphaeraceae archaeon]|nr:pyridoxal 5'-phosphate synthase glutaminase subunit PdxT [Nitrososphaeraceae archaeon]MDW0137289.1 pyridoxal 5'-phosphate synthase glutaminase subunit PdxT [Nitrososphaeraceae archaeon]MDW0138494.1 pyridoxal 5'-phosphate synthase glutaminase subunit PdxT [Nitrososphaeraceae archaeon]MDW0143067.1 pyridoxal 5'-phosphate synthase glutaminase subunit PdxT [Nitrososphaeraceae archaeon]MDW0145083.1 pyridoxal 5'-phosphate synthase glutaminase subunit PdxT [Nitrososphaeraceae archaeon]
MNNELLVGVLALQGDVEENIKATTDALREMNLKGKVISVRYPDEILKVDGLIIPGGESTVMGLLLSIKHGLLDSITKVLQNRIPIMGTCAGMIVLAKKSYDKVVGNKKQLLLGALDIEIERNSFGRQYDSFESTLEISGIGNDFKGIFIRAPTVISTGSHVQILSKFDGKIVAVQQENIIGTSFHPELSGDNRMHRLFIELITKWKKANNRQ